MKSPAPLSHVLLLLAYLLVFRLPCPALAGDLQFSLRIDGFVSGGNPAHEAAMALWNDPMNRLMRDTNAELGRILVGQPGGMAAPLIGISFRGGVEPEIIAGIIDNSLLFSRQEIAKLNWDTPPSDEEFQRQFIEDFAHRLEAAAGLKKTPEP